MFFCLVLRQPCQESDAWGRCVNYTTIPGIPSNTSRTAKWQHPSVIQSLHTEDNPTCWLLNAAMWYSLGTHWSSKLYQNIHAAKGMSNPMHWIFIDKCIIDTTLRNIKCRIRDMSITEHIRPSSLKGNPLVPPWCYQLPVTQCCISHWIRVHH